MDERPRFQPTAWSSSHRSDVTILTVTTSYQSPISGPRSTEPAADRFAREGVAIASVTDELNTLANSLMNLAWVQRHGNDMVGAHRSFTGAVDLYERKGNVAAARSSAI
jgi:hypothetical protein